MLHIISEVQIKTTDISHLLEWLKHTPPGTDNTEYWWGWRAIGTSGHHWWECKMVQPHWRQFGGFPVKLNLRDSNFNPRYLFKKDENLYSHKYYTGLFIAILFPLPSTAAISRFLNWWTDKQTGLSKNSTKKRILDTCSNIDESQMYYVKWEMPDSKGYTR